MYIRPRRLRLALVTLGCLAAVLELLEMSRWVLIAATATWDPWYAAELAAIAARATWDWWYAAELAAILAGIVTVCALLYREWQR